MVTICGIDMLDLHRHQCSRRGQPSHPNSKRRCEVDHVRPRVTLTDKHED